MQGLHPLPYGDAYPNITLFADDKYGLNHPVFNISVLADLRVTVNQEDYEALITPVNLYHHGYISGTMWFDNDKVSAMDITASLKMKGFSSRLFPKNSFKLKFSKKWYGQKILGLRSFCCDGTFMKDVISADFFNMMKVPFYRGSHSSLWINDVYHGLYMIHEDVSKNMMESRFGNNKGNLYKGSRACFEYEGSDPQYYEDLIVPQPPPSNSTMSRLARLINVTKLVYQQKEGNGDFSDLVKFITILNITNRNTFAQSLDAYFDIDSYLRSLVVESFSNNNDGYARNCNNWAMYMNPPAKKFFWVPHDVDGTFEGNYTESIVDFDRLLTRRILEIPAWRSLYLSYYKTFMSHFTLDQLLLRVDQVAVVLSIGSENDRFNDLYHEFPYVPYADRVQTMKKWITGRYNYVTAVLRNL